VGDRPEQAYYAIARAIDAKQPYRLVPATPRPMVPGLERAVVDGASESEYAQLDAAGSYRVKLAFDEGDATGDRSSTRLRMMQPHAGNPEGMHFPLRKGTEVLVAFLGGDPDRPVVAGAVPNADTPSPVTQANQTRNIIHMGGDSVIEIEDNEGAQWVDIRTPVEGTSLHFGTPHNPTHFIQILTAGDCRFKIGINQDIRVKGNLNEDVTGAITETYKTSQTSIVTGPKTTKVKNPVREEYSGGHTTTVTKAVSELYAAGQKTTSGAARSERYEAGQTTVVLGGATLDYQVANHLTVSGTSNQVHVGSKATIATGAAQHFFDSNVTQIFGPTAQVYGDTVWTIAGKADVFTSTWNLANASHSILHSTLDKIHLNKGDATSVSISALGAKDDKAVAYVGANGLKVSIQGLAQRNMTGLKFELNGIKIACYGASWKRFRTGKING
jgi:type VI secretion system secreted protein VgrG